MLGALLEEMEGVPDENVTVIIGTGNHAVHDKEELGLSEDLLTRFRYICHSSRDDDNVVNVGQTSRRNDVLVNREFAAADVKVLLGAIKPHYFAGYAGGAKAVLPSVAHIRTISVNHARKVEPRAKLGVTDNNPVRGEMEEAARLCGTSFILNVVSNARGEVAAAVAGDVVQAHRAGVVHARRVCEVDLDLSAHDVIVASDSFPIAMNLYQASKLCAPAGWLLANGGTLILACECPEGVGSELQIVNLAIYGLGMKQFLPPEHRVVLASAMDAKTVRTTFCQFAPDLQTAFDEALERHGPDARIAAIPRGGHLVPRKKGLHY
jgi:nickel-dependent lactate racemase